MPCKYFIFINLPNIDEEKYKIFQGHMQPIDFGDRLDELSDTPTPSSQGDNSYFALAWGIEVAA